MKNKIGEVEISVVLGSGLNETDAFRTLKPLKSISYHQISGIKPTTAGHKGVCEVYEIAGKRVLFQFGRIHFYEGYSMKDITKSIRIYRKLGAKVLILTSATGGINKRLKPGDIVLIKDHINLMGDNPLVGPHDGQGPRFPDMTFAYDAELRKLVREIDTKIREGVYIAVRGPSYETPSEINAFRRLGADVVGMSVVPEVIVAAQVGMRVLALTYISNMAAGVLKKKLSHEEVIETGKKVAEKLVKLIFKIIENVTI